MPTFNSPNGVKLRCESKRRYWIIGQWERNFDQVARVERRTDNIETARTFARQARGRAIFDSARKAYTP